MPTTASPTHPNANFNGTGSFSYSLSDGNGGTATATVTVSANTPPTAVTLLLPPVGATEVSPDDLTVTFEKSTDAEGDAIRYSFCLSEGDNLFDPSDCTDIPATEAMIEKGVLFAGMGMSGAGFFWLGNILLAGFDKKKRSRGLMVLFFASALLLTSCGSGGTSNSGVKTQTPINEEVQLTVPTLKSSTTYFWKIVATDEKGGTTESEVRNFTTQ